VGSRERENPFSDCAVRVCGREPLNLGIWLIRSEFGPLVGHLVAFDALVAWTPPDLDPDVGFFSPEGVFPGLERVLLSWPGVAGGHPPDGRLRVGEDGYRTERVVSGFSFHP